MSRSRLRPLDLALQIGESFAAVDIHGDGLVSAVDKPQERIDGAPGPRLREWWHYYEFAFAEYQPIDLIVESVKVHTHIFARHYRARARITARLIYGEFDENDEFTPDHPPQYHWLTLSQAEKAFARTLKMRAEKKTFETALYRDMERNQEGEMHKVVSSRGGTHAAMIDTLEYQLQAPKNWRVSDW